MSVWYEGRFFSNTIYTCFGYGKSMFDELSGINRKSTGCLHLLHSENGFHIVMMLLVSVNTYTCTTLYHWRMIVECMYAPFSFGTIRHYYNYHLIGLLSYTKYYLIIILETT